MSFEKNAQITEQDIVELAETLCIELSPEELPGLAHDLCRLFSALEGAEHLETEPHIWRAATAVDDLREDAPGDCLSQEDALAMASRRNGNFFAVGLTIENKEAQA
jgi:aspartyl/glutamyl-tRNA(Asn/Gln) amidotransferase C subunit